MAQGRNSSDGGTPSTFFAGLKAPAFAFQRRRLNEWAFTLTQSENRRHVLDLGCLGGDNTKSLLKQCPNAKVVGIDPSSVAIEKAQRLLKEEAQEGRCELIVAPLNEMPLRNKAFELVVAADNIQSFPEGTLKEAYRVLKPSGTLLIYNLNEDKISKEEILFQVVKAGFSEIRDFSDTEKGYIGIVACKR